MTTFIGMDDFAARAPVLFDAMRKELQLAAQAEAFRQIKPLVRAYTPVGGILTKDRHPGQMKTQWVERDRTGGTKVVASLTPYGGIIDRGRKRGVTPRGAKRAKAKRGEKLKPHKEARMLGSKQARSGITRPAVKTIMDRRESIIRVAIAAAEVLAK